MKISLQLDYIFYRKKYDGVFRFCLFAVLALSGRRLTSLNTDKLGPSRNRIYVFVAIEYRHFFLSENPSCAIHFKRA